MTHKRISYISHLVFYRSSVTFAPNGQHLVVSSLDSIHRLFCYKSSNAFSSNSAGPKYLKSFKSHYNKRFSIITAVTSFRNKNVSGSYLVSGSEDNQVSISEMLIRSL
jgi:WD40 repeat protein